MKQQFDHNLMSSVFLWFDSRLCTTGEAVITGKTQIFKNGSGINTPSNMIAFYSDANQFCVDNNDEPWNETVFTTGGTLTASPFSPSQYRYINFFPSGNLVESGTAYTFSVDVTGWNNHPGVNVYLNGTLTGTFGTEIGSYSLDFTANASGRIPLYLNYWSTPFTAGTLQYTGTLQSEYNRNYVLSDGVKIYQDTTGDRKVIIDNDKARIIMDSSYGTGLPLSGNFVQKEINLYMTNETEEEIILRNEFYLESGQSFSDYSNQLAVAKYYFPCVFLTSHHSSNKGFAMGGLRDTSSFIRAVVFARYSYQLDAILSLFRDAGERCLKIIDSSSFPYGEYWHMKSYPYNYTDFVNTYAVDDAFIKRVEVYKLKDTAQSAVQKIRKDIFLGYIDIEISSIRSV